MKGRHCQARQESKTWPSATYEHPSLNVKSHVIIKEKFPCHSDSDLKMDAGVAMAITEQ